MRQLNDFSFNTFQKLLCDDDYSIFIDKEEGDRLAGDFSEIIKSKSASEIIELENEIQHCVLYIETAKLFMAAMSNRYDPDIAEILRTELDFGYELSEESYLADLEIIATECIGVEGRLNSFIAIRDEKFGGQNSGRATRTDYAKYSNAMRKAGFIIPNDITALDWAVAFKDFRDKAD